MNPTTTSTVPWPGPPGAMWGRVLALGALEKAIKDGITGNADPDAYLRQWWGDLNAAWDREHKRDANEPQHGKPKP